MEDKFNMHTIKKKPKVQNEGKLSSAIQEQYHE